MEYGRFNFENGGYDVLTPKTPTPWKMPLFNDNYVTFIDQLLQGLGSALVPKKYNSKVITPGNREFWIRDNDTNECFKINDSKDDKNYKFTHYIDRVELERIFGTVTVTVTIFVPTVARREYWKVTVTNNSDTPKNLALFSHIGFLENGGMGGTCWQMGNAIVKYTFPHHHTYEDKEKCEKFEEHYYILSDTAPTSCDMSTYNFRGGYLDDSVPEAVKNGRCSNIIGEAEDYCGVMHHEFSLATNQSKTICFALGVEASTEKIAAFSERFTADFVNSELQKVSAYWQDICEESTIKTSDAEFDELVNKWLKKQVVYLTRTNRMGPTCPVRNQLQDAMGYGLIKPELAKEFFYDVFVTQRSDGYIKQWHNTNGAKPAGIAALEHCDGPIWVTVCGVILASQIGKDYLYEKVPFADGGEDTVLEHIVRALRYMSKDVGAHGICLMRDGDWTDPINGIGRLGRGESAWASMGVMYGAKLLKELLQALGDTKYLDEVTAIWENTDKLVNELLWEEDRYIGGFDDDGIPFADKADENRILLNVQTWALLSGAARGERAEILKNTIDSITCELGPYTIYPGFDKWDARWGRISIKKNGTTENGAVYCHAAMFKAFSDTVYRDGDAMLETLVKVTPMNPENPMSKNRQLPLFVPNYYYSLKGSANFGRSSCNYGTGSAAWFLMSIYEGLFGLRATINGIELTPNIPTDWEDVTCKRKYKNAVYNVTYKKGVDGITVNGVALQGKTLPYEDGAYYNIIYGLN